jgi:hypothetical protein
MDKMQIKIVIIGHLRHQIDFNKIKRASSSFFKISIIERINDLPKPKKDDGYLDISYSKTEIQEILKGVQSQDIVVGIMNYPFDDNFYMHRAGENKLCISIAGIDIMLLNKGISLENFIIKNIYEAVVLKNIFADLNNNDIYNFIHQDTRGCLFDMNGYRYDVVYNTEKPFLCDTCKSFLNQKSLPTNFVKHLEKELKRIKKPIICSIEMFIKKYPLLSVFLTFISSFTINILASWVWELFKK